MEFLVLLFLQRNGQVWLQDIYLILIIIGCQLCVDGWCRSSLTTSGWTRSTAKRSRQSILQLEKLSVK